MLAGFTTDRLRPVRSVGGVGTFGAVFVGAAGRVFDCTEAPNPSGTGRREYSAALATVNPGIVNVALRGVPTTGVSVTLATAHVGEQGTPVLSVWTHW